MFFRKKKPKEQDHFESKFIPDDWFYAYPTSPIDMFREELEKEMKESKESKE